MKNLETIHTTTGTTLNLFYKLRTTGQFFTATFIKKDGSIRTMNARCNVKKYKKGGKLAFNASEKGLLSVFDMVKMEYRFINLDTLISIVYKSKLYLFKNDQAVEQFIKTHIFVVSIK